MSELILTLKDGPIATVVLNRPEKLNALTKPMWQRLGDVVNELSQDDALRCVVLRGAGGNAFAPGNDNSEFKSERANSAQGKAYGAVLHMRVFAATTPKSSASGSRPFSPRRRPSSSVGDRPDTASAECAVHLG
ncbi:MAG: enoyl-CoA hydratase/isomerase family protein [Burkholderiaceae bacterium]